MDGVKLPPIVPAKLVNVPIELFVEFKDVTLIEPDVIPEDDTILLALILPEVIPVALTLVTVLLVPLILVTNSVPTVDTVFTMFVTNAVPDEKLVFTIFVIVLFVPDTIGAVILVLATSVAVVIFEAFTFVTFNDTLVTFVDDILLDTNAEIAAFELVTFVKIPFAAPKLAVLILVVAIRDEEVIDENDESPAINVPVKRPDPLTSNVYAGLVVEIPTFPPV